MNVQDRIRQQLGAAKIVLYMKGTPQSPQCGFSARAVKLLAACGAQYQSHDVLADPDLRQGLKEHSNWPTFPQLYVNGELVGGCDIMAELYQKGELQKLVARATG
ncbi:MAG: monothiol glutaredoxin, Grx4 family [Candidatus Muproteobacteria bacterium RIFCSPHIGHO2_01_FULL_65_16]|uniref:Glutaredoxin n=1 Tax=Candidatus Muproteobacteria bacterium RIFCSPHIGHO2_01_FULL_65_16 TaxID=1817764 RepID=A0A1F6TNC2_9PROT|nr:MAG: monothiol glutaredoxin, Grx4 family [Candidatus Muproteobacteria bacterium RIFCSPHIGHO2_01_FULL_65_16]